jgi:glycosyltransferase involved in cell wall biosynthesis
MRRPSQTRTVLRTELNIPEHAFVWAMAGTRSVNKNLVRFVRSADALSRHDRDVHFLWIGGEENGYSIFARRLAASLGVADRVTWIAARGDDYYSYLSIADALMLTSTQEALSLVTIEMAAMGKPIVTTASGGPSEIVTSGLGIVVDSWNLDDFVSALHRVMRGEVHLDAASARRRAAEFDISSTIKKWERLVEQFAPQRSTGISE